MQATISGKEAKTINYLISRHPAATRDDQLPPHRKLSAYRSLSTDERRGV